MKILLYLIIVAATGWAGWFCYPDVRNWMAERIEARKTEEQKRIESAVNKAKQDERVDPGTGGSKAGALLASLANKQPAGANPSLPPPPGGAKPAESGTKPTVSTPPPAPVDEIDARYPMPTFKTIEEITKEWSAIPSKAFTNGRKVKTKVPLAFDVPAGKVELPAGSDARAVGMVAGMLIVMREGDNTSRIQVPLANTDLKETLTALYEKYKDYRRNLVIKQREHARALKARSNGASEEQMKAAGPKPEVRAGGVIPIMLASLQEKKLVELKPENITSWGNLDYEDVGGTVYWTGTVQCMVENALFGPQPTEVMALIKDNKVVKWIYTGSREEVQ